MYIEILYVYVYIFRLLSVYNTVSFPIHLSLSFFIFMIDIMDQSYILVFTDSFILHYTSYISKIRIFYFFLSTKMGA